MMVMMVVMMMMISQQLNGKPRLLELLNGPTGHSVIGAFHKLWKRIALSLFYRSSTVKSSDVNQQCNSAAHLKASTYVDYITY